MALKLNYPTIKLPNGGTYDLATKSKEEIIKELEPDQKLSYISNQLDQISKIATRFYHYNISINKTNGNDEFCTSDVPIVLNNGEAKLVELLDPGCHIMLNISHDKCLTLMPPTGSSRNDITRIQLQEYQSKLYTMINNDHQYRNCERFLLGRESGLLYFDECKKLSTNKEAMAEIRRQANKELEQTIAKHIEQQSKREK